MRYVLLEDYEQKNRYDNQRTAFIPKGSIVEIATDFEEAGYLLSSKNLWKKNTDEFVSKTITVDLRDLKLSIQEPTKVPKSAEHVAARAAAIDQDIQDLLDSIDAENAFKDGQDDVLQEAQNLIDQQEIELAELRAEGGLETEEEEDDLLDGLFDSSEEEEGFDPFGETEEIDLDGIF